MHVTKHLPIVSGLPAVVLSLVALGGCAQLAGTTSPSSVSAAAVAAASGTWKLQTLTQSNTTVTISDPGTFTVEFSDGNRLSARVDCNRAMGGYTTNGGVLTVGPLAVTKAYCSSSPLDDNYLTVLIGDSTAQATATSLTLTSSRGTLQFVR